MNDSHHPAEGEVDTGAKRRIRSLLRFLSFLGPGFFVTVGFIDPGNWATNVAAGSSFGYSLLWVITLSTVVLILWQHMAAHLGIVQGKSLAACVREHASPWAAAVYGSTAFAACIATALAEILGAALGIHLLFGIPVHLAAVISVILVGAALWLQHYRSLEKIIVAFVALIGFCYMVELYIVKPDWASAAHHTFIPHLNSSNVLVAIGLLGAVVMPHNIYLHSEVILSRKRVGMTEREIRRLLRYEFLDTLVSMLVGMAINMAMILVAAAVFYKHGTVVTDLLQASATLKPLAGRLASLVFGIGLLFAGIASSMTAGVAGGTIFSEYIRKERSGRPPLFRVGMITTLAAACLLIFFIHNTLRALIVSQVCLSIQLPFTMLPVLLLTKDDKIMGVYSTGWLEKSLMGLTGVIIVGLNILLVWQLLGGTF